MKKIIVLSFVITLFIGCKDNKQKSSPEDNNIQTELKEDAKSTDTTKTKKKVLSPHTSAMEMVGDAHIHIDYSSPRVRNRVIYGGLVPYNAVWQAGAHMATWLETNKDLTINGKLLPAGKYSFFVIPNENKWTIIFNSNWKQHRADDYDKNQDVLRFEVTPIVSDNVTEELEYKINKTDETKGTISFAWEKVFISFPFEVNK
jgi:Protein of unknown function (DUF2911)